MSKTRNSLKCGNSLIKWDFNGRSLTHYGGLPFFCNFMQRIGIWQSMLAFQIDEKIRIHSDSDCLIQAVLMAISGLFNDSDADKIRIDPGFCGALGKFFLAARSTLNRFFLRAGPEAVQQLSDMIVQWRRNVYYHLNPKYLCMDIDTTLPDTFGNQEGAGYNGHYRNNGYHPLLVYDSITRDLIAVFMREGETYCSNGTAEDLRGLLTEIRSEWPDIEIILRGDAGFADPKIYEVCEEFGVTYVIRLKDNATLKQIAAPLEQQAIELSLSSTQDTVELFDEFEYQAGSWDRKRRVFVSVRKNKHKKDCEIIFVVTNFSDDILPDKGIKVYRNRGSMENLNAECKTGVDFRCTHSRSMLTNTFRVLVRALAYNIFNYYRRIVLNGTAHANCGIQTFRERFILITTQIAHSAGYLIYHLDTQYAYQKDFLQMQRNIELAGILFGYA